MTVLPDDGLELAAEFPDATHEQWHRLGSGGLRQSGNGWREAGTQALDVYSDLKTIYINHNPDAV